MSYLLSCFFEFFCELGLNLTETFKRCGFEAKDEYRLCVGGSQKSPAVFKLKSNTIKINDLTIEF